MSALDELREELGYITDGYLVDPRPLDAEINEAIDAFEAAHKYLVEDPARMAVDGDTDTSAKGWDGLRDALDRYDAEHGGEA